MLSRYLLLASAVVMVAACSTTEDPNLSGAPNGQPDTITQGPLSDIYAQDVNAPVPGSVEDFTVNVGDRVFFGYDRYDLSTEARATLEAQAQWLMQYPDLSITVEGHADERGTREYNLALGERRATATENYLVALGVDPRRVKTISYGKERPSVPGSNEAAWAQNRRGVTKID